MGGADLLLMSLCMSLRNDTNITEENCTIQPKVPDDVGYFNIDMPAATTADIREKTVSALSRELRITTYSDMPFSGTREVNGSLVGDGFAFDLFQLIQKKLNFTYRIVLPKQNVLGDANTGVFGLLAKGEVDMAVAFLPIVTRARNIFTYSTALDDVDWTLLMKRPQASATGSGLLAPFDKSVWLLILVSLIVTGPVIYILIWIRTKITENAETVNYSLPVCMWFVYSGVMKQATAPPPLTDSARLLFATWWIFITILTSFYTANLTAFLTLSFFTLPINNVRDLAATNQKWFANKGGAIETILGEASEGISLLQKSVENKHGNFYDLNGEPPSSVLRYIKKDMVYLREKQYSEALLFDDYLNKTNAHVKAESRCTYVVMPGNIIVLSRAFAFPKNSTIRPIIDPQLLKLVESGVIGHIMSSKLPAATICPLNLKSTERQMRNSDLIMTWEALGLGLGLALIAFIGETLYRRNRCCKKKSFINNKPELPIYSFKPTSGFVKKTPPPLYNNLDNPGFTKKHFINGRDYYVVTKDDGDRRLVPVRTPSALLFQYAA